MIETHRAAIQDANALFDFNADGPTTKSQRALVAGFKGRFADWTEGEKTVIETHRAAIQDSNELFDVNADGPTAKAQRLLVAGFKGHFADWTEDEKTVIETHRAAIQDADELLISMLPVRILLPRHKAKATSGAMSPGCWCTERCDNYNGARSTESNGVCKSDRDQQTPI